MPGETDVNQHRVKLKNNTPIHCKPYSLLRGKRYGMKGQYAKDTSGETFNAASRIYIYMYMRLPSSWLRRKMVLTGYVLTLGS